MMMVDVLGSVVVVMVRRAECGVGSLKVVRCEEGRFVVVIEVVVGVGFIDIHGVVVMVSSVL